MRPSGQRLVWVVVTAGLIAGLLALDVSRGGPASELSRCNLALSRSADPAADVLVIGSSRMGTAIDPIAMEKMFAEEPLLNRPTVERIALGRSPLRANLALLENYLGGRGDPAVIVFEVSFLSDRTVDRIDQLGSGLSADAFLFRRDVNLIRYRQLLTAPAVAMPFSEAETAVNRLRYALRGTVLRNGALVYQLAREPAASFSLEDCDVDTWTREPTWPDDFAFSWDETSESATPTERIEALRADINLRAPGRELHRWQVGAAIDRRYPYDLDQPYRSGELALLDRVVEHAAERRIPVVLLPLPVSGSRVSTEDIEFFNVRFGGDANVYDLYGATEVDLSTYWYDDAHLRVRTAGELTTALLAQRLTDGPLNTAGLGQSTE